MTLDKDLFENHLEFFATQRGTVIRQDGWVLVDSSSSEFTCAFAESASNLERLPPRIDEVRLLPWSVLTAEQVLAAGCRATKTLTYMTLKGALLPHAAVNGLTIEIVRSERAMQTFTHVQAQCFVQEGDSFDWWQAWLRQKHQGGLTGESQRFYVASIDGEPACAAALVLTEKVIGIYGLATLPSHRRRGASSALLARAIDDARCICPFVVPLQVMNAGAYAEAFSQKVGFQTAFVSPAFVRA